MKNINLQNIKNIHFLGIGGIGMSALARMMHDQGKKVSGSDIALSEITHELEKLGIVIYPEQKLENISGDVELVVYSLALKKYAPTLLEQLEEKGKTLLTYPEFLGALTRGHYTIAVTGTHGKTTTTSLTGQMLIDLGVNPTIVVGSILAKQKSNYVKGSSDYFIVEGCEYQRSFLQLSPKILVITNIEADHLDYYKDLADIQSAFAEAVAKVPADGFVVCDVNDVNVHPVLKNISATLVNYMSFYDDGLQLKIPGDYNKKNAAIALAIAHTLHLDQEKAKQSLENFAGVWRRFEYKGETKNGTAVYDDYAHHPTEITNMLAGAREKFAEKKIVAVFEPHLFSRTRDFLDEFGKSFTDADEVVLLPIYYAREVDDGSISSADLEQKIKEQGKDVRLFKNYDEAVKYLQQDPRIREDEGGSVIITVGAGTVHGVGERLVESM